MYVEEVKYYILVTCYEFEIGKDQSWIEFCGIKALLNGCRVNVKRN